MIMKMIFILTNRKDDVIVAVKRPLTSDELKYLKMQNRLFHFGGYNPYSDKSLEEYGLTDAVKDEEVLVIASGQEAVTGFIGWMKTGADQKGFTRDMIMKKNRQICEYFDNSVIQITTSAFIHTDSNVLLLDVFEHYAYAEHTLTMVQGHVDCSVEGLDESMKYVVESEDSFDARVAFGDILKNNVIKEINEELMVKDSDEKPSDLMDIGGITVLYTPFTDGLTTHIGVVFDVSVTEYNMKRLRAREHDKHYCAWPYYIEELFKEIDNLDPWVYTYMATCKSNEFREAYATPVFEKMCDTRKFDLIDEDDD